MHELEGTDHRLVAAEDGEVHEIPLRGDEHEPKATCWCQPDLVAATAAAGTWRHKEQTSRGAG